MNLFQEETKDFLRPLIHNEEWVNILSNYVEVDKMKKLASIVREERRNHNVYPEPQAVFRVFKECPFSKVKIIIVGQDPYHNGNADGLAFSCRERMSPSLGKIIFAIIQDIHGSSSGIKYGIKLDYLASQGVFLYNTILTVRANKPLSHKGIGWEHFTDCVFKALSTKKDLIWLAWGKEAQQSITGKTNSNHIIMKESHPASAAYSNTSWKCNHFSMVNAILKDEGKETIKWI